MKRLPDLEVLSRLFSYDPAKGILLWRIRIRNGIEVGDHAGTTTKRGYLQVGFNKRYYLVHRIIWKMMTGDDPIEVIDHIDGDRLNNRWSNLRSATNGQNKQNGRRYRNNTSGVKGICWETYHQRWKAYVSTGGRQVRLGRYTSFNAAVAAVTEARMRLHGDFARFK